MAEIVKEFEPGSGNAGRSWLKSEDYWAILLGLTLLVIGLLIYWPSPPESFRTSVDQYNAIMAEESANAPFQTLAWHQASRAKGEIRATSQDFAKTIKRWTAKPHGWSDHPLESFVLSKERATVYSRDAKLRLEESSDASRKLEIKAREGENLAREAGFADLSRNAAAERAIREYIRDLRVRGNKLKKIDTKAYNQLGYLVGFGLSLALLFAVVVQVMSGKGSDFLKGFGLVYLLAVTAYFIAGQADVKAMGIGYAAWAITLGLMISNTVGTPTWAKPAIQVEFYIKTGLVLLGAEILFGKILIIGIPGIFVAWVVTPIVLVATYWFGQTVLKIESKSLNMTLSADMSVCGVSAAIATASVCGASKEELTLAVGISLIFTSIMMVILPNIILALDMNHVLGGAWMGGTIDSTGAVAAAGAFLGEKALYVAATIKMIQNILIGVIALAVAWYWAKHVDRSNAGQQVSAMEIWRRFPKFIIGFLGASIVFSLLYHALGDDMGTVMVSHGAIDGWSKIFRGWFFCLAFVSIGLSTDFKMLSRHLAGGKPVILYVCGQSFNLLLTLLTAYLMFFVVFPNITARI
ncbi:MAG: putative sulfate exporter family transporter [Methylococcus sp.]|nr:MAG: putative sulfate exporter family transporter [Methylococcus sp.]